VQFYGVGHINYVTALMGAWMQLHQTWWGHRAVIAALQIKFGYLSAFSKAGCSNFSDVENNATFHTFGPLWKLEEG